MHILICDCQLKMFALPRKQCCTQVPCGTQRRKPRARLWRCSVAEHLTLRAPIDGMRWGEAAGEPGTSAPSGTMGEQRRDVKSTTMAISSIREETRATPRRSRTQSAGVKEETA